MKNIVLFIVILFLFVGCNPKITKIEREESVFGVDFREYSKKGFLFTPYSYDGKYEPVGLIIFSIKSGAEYKKLEAKFDYQKKFDQFKWYYDIVETGQVVEFAYKKAVDLGADAICDFKIDFEYESVFTGTENISLPVLKVWGFAIKRIN